MSERTESAPSWLPYLDLGCVAVACGLWYAFPEAGPWPLLLALAPWVLRFLLTRRLTYRTSFDLLLALFVLSAGVSVWAAYDRQAAWPKFWLIVGGVLLFYALVNAEQLALRRAWLLALFGAGVALYFLVTHDWDVYPAKIGVVTLLGRALQEPLPHLKGHRLHPNVAGGIMAMMWPFAALVVAQAWTAARAGPGSFRHWASLGVALALLATISFGLLLTTSRGAWIALAGAVLLVAIWAASGWLTRNRPARRVCGFLVLLVVLLALAVGAVIAWPGGPAAAVARLPGPNTAIDRLQLLRNSLTLVRDYPLVGSGLGGFMMLYSTYALLIHVGHSVHSHSLYLNISLEQGLPALLILVSMWFLFAVAAWRGLGSPRRGGSGLLGAAALSLAVVLVHGFVDDPLYGSRAVVLLFVPLAFAVPFLRPDGGRFKRAWLYVLPLAIIVSLIPVIVWRGEVLSLVSSNLGAVRQSQVELSVYDWPEWPLQDDVRRTVDLDQVIARFERALSLDPRNATANRRLGMIELARGDYEGALRHLEAAYAVEPRSETTRQLLGEAYIVNGRQAEGQALLAEVGHRQGQLAARVFWYEYIGDTERSEWLKKALGDP